LSRLTELLRQARKADPQLGADLEAEIAALTKRRTFGLVFEPHQPEAVELPGRLVRRGDKVRVLPPRGENKTGDQRLWRVQRIERVDGQRVAHLLELDAEDSEVRSVPADDVVVVAEFRDRIYPGLVETGRVERGGDKPFHTVINAENYHALEMLTYTHRHSIDVIYIDPPYNNRASDWKYNNNYVEKDDDYRHSKWLAFLERRLRIAKELLNPDDSVLIVTIDENEVHRLGLLLEQVFPEAPSQMISTVINPKGASLGRDFARVDEYIFVLYFGSAGVCAEVRDMLDDKKNSAASTSVKWSSLIRGGAQGVRTDSPGAFYPVFVDPDANRIHSFGEPLPWGVDKLSVSAPEGTIAVWPPDHPSGVEGRWGIGPSKARQLYALGALRLGKVKVAEGKFPLSYLSSGIMSKVESGEIITEGRTAGGTLVVRYPSDTKVTQPKTVWKMSSHNAGEYGSKLVSLFLPRRKFPFPKSLYAVEDILRFFVKTKPTATVLDFFAGSGTTAHAIMRLNREDGGSRTAIVVTNNEASAVEERRLRAQGARPGDAEWEALGICDYITKPRLMAAVTGRTPEGEPIDGDYKFSDEFPMSDGLEENAAFFTLTYEAPLSVRHNRAFRRVAPMLWLRAGSQGRMIDDLGDKGWDVAESYGVLENLDQVDEFVTAVNSRDNIEIAYIVTDDDSAFQMVCRELAGEIVPVRLYESYLQNFEINTGRSL